MYKCVFVMCPAHSGSTLAGYILGAHSKITNLGEFSYFSKKPYNKGAFYAITREMGECVMCGNDCRYWREFRRAINSEHYHDIAQQTFQTPIIVDTSKKLDWVWDNASKVDGSVAIIRVVRDARHRFRKDIEKAGMLNGKIVRNWLKKEKAISKLCKSFTTMTVKYEGLCSERTIVGICDFLGIGYEPMMNYWKSPTHAIGGDANCRSLFRHYHKIAPRCDRAKNADEFFREQGYSTKPHMSKLSTKDLGLLEGLGGMEMNRKFGYGSG